MAHGKSLDLARIRPQIYRIWTPREWAMRPGTVPGDPALRPRGAVPKPRRERRRDRAGDPYIYPKRSR